MGTKKEKKKVIKPSEKFKFEFNWDLGDDTSRDNNPLYSNKLGVRPMFGRGLLAGIDKKEQLKVCVGLFKCATNVFLGFPKHCVRQRA